MPRASKSSPSPRRKLLFLTKENPFPPAGGAHLRDSQLIQLLQETMDVEVLCYAPESENSVPAAFPPGVKITRIQRTTRQRWKKAFETLRPDLQNNYSQAIEQALRERAEPGKLLWISRLIMAKYLEVAKSFGYQTILDEHQVETRILWNNAMETASRFKTTVKGMGSLAVAAQCHIFESRMCRLSNLVVAASDLDASRLMRLAPGIVVHVIPHSIDCAQYSSLRTQPGQNILFSGALNHPPNVEGLTWFLCEVLPRVRASLRDRTPKLVVAGSNPSEGCYQLLDHEGTELFADPPSMIPHLANAAIVIIPIQSGRSMRFKILEAMAAGRAVISTPRGAEGLLLSPAYDIWIADAADKFASTVARLIETPELRAETAHHGALTVDARYDWRCMKPLLESLIQKLVRPTPKARLTR
ncbi:glycosyltransferase family 4 protein [Bdellovibrionota bacterium FG-1]